MASRITSQSALRGFLVPDKRLELDEATSSFTEHGGRPGIDIPTNTTDKMIIYPSNAQEDDLTFKAVKGGLAGSASVKYKYTADADATYKGYMYPTFLMSTEVLKFNTTASGNKYENKSMVTIPSTGNIVLALAKTDRFLTINGGIHISHYTASTNTWSEPTTLVVDGNNIGSTAENASVSLLFDDSENILYMFVISGSVSDGNFYGKAFYSQDYGTTWSIWSENIVPSQELAVDRYNLFSFKQNGDLYLISSLKYDASNSRYNIYKSTDSGSTFILIYQSNNTDYDNPSALSTLPNTSTDHIFYYFTTFVQTLNNNIIQFAITSGGDIFKRNISSLARHTDEEFVDTTLSIGTATTTEDDSVCLLGFVDYNNIVYLYSSSSITTANTGPIYASSIDNGFSFKEMLSPFTFKNGNMSIRKLVASPSCGRIMMVGNSSDSILTNLDNNLFAFELGGWSEFTLDRKQNTATENNNYDFNIELQQSTSFYAPLSNAGSSPEYGSFTWFAGEDPSEWVGADVDNILTSSGSGSGSVTFTSGTKYMEMDFSGGAARKTWYLTDTTYETRSIIMSAKLRSVSNGSTSTPRPGIFFRLVEDGTATPKYLHIGVHLTTSSIALYDYNAGASIGSQTIDSGSFYDVMLVGSCKTFTSGADCGFFDVFYRKEGTLIWNKISDRSAARVLTNAGVITTVAGFGQAGTNFDSGTTTAVSYWKAFSCSLLKDNEYTSSNLYNASNATTYNKVQGCPTSSFPYPLREIETENSKQQFFRAISGPAKPNEIHEIDKNYQYAIENIMHENEPSPNIVWESSRSATATVPEQQIVFSLDNISSLGNTSPAIYLENINFGLAQLQGFTSPSTWTTIASIRPDLDAVDVEYTFAGDTVTSSNSVMESLRYFNRNELVGGTITLYDSGFSNPKYRRILSNTEGYFGGSSKRCVLKIEVLGTEHASGKAVIWTPRILAIRHNTTTNYSKYRLRIPAQEVAPVNGLYSFKIGTMLVGSFVPVGQQWALQHTQTATPNVEITVNQQGTSKVRKLGEIKRSWTVTWSDGMDMSKIYDLEADWLADDSGNKLATHRDVADQLIGIYEDLDSGEVPTVICSSVSTATTGTINISDPTLMLYGRITSPISKENVLGDEGEDQVIRVSSVTIDGIV